MSQPQCPKCKSQYSYQDGNLWICPECSHEWTDADLAATQREEPAEEAELVVLDANGNVLADGDAVVVIKDLKVKGASSALKSGTKVKNIRLQSSSDGHNISCKIDGFGAMNLKSEFVRKA